ncbi:AzlD domain-containing protein [Nakamurella antarctica]|uniref:AzlD domain-containing protein n=1 Tax=Nakamurella antarctica TaxID=1902245 RepID=A0A3G8ZWC9_9ACTN|nr:AzlD domain-containing protein [Nakamurella antarctica]AZI57971.1 AzlD domain-containing protein [Nakamurella antarctica]
MIWLGIALGSIGCYALKVAGLSIPLRVLDNPRVQRVATALPVALLAALVAIQSFASGQHLAVDARVVGLVVALFAVWRKWPFLVVVLLAAASTALVRSFLGW